jgi:hypothetical protein
MVVAEVAGFIWARAQVVVAVNREGGRGEGFGSWGPLGWSGQPQGQKIIYIYIIFIFIYLKNVK